MAIIKYNEIEARLNKLCATDAKAYEIEKEKIVREGYVIEMYPLAGYTSHLIWKSSCSTLPQASGEAVRYRSHTYLTTAEKSDLSNALIETISK